MNQTEENKNKKSDRKYYLLAFKIMGDFGASIAIPVVIFVLAGQFFDERFHSRPLFVILGFVIAALISAKIIYRRAKRYGQEYQNLEKK